MLPASCGSVTAIILTQKLISLQSVFKLVCVFLADQ